MKICIAANQQNQFQLLKIKQQSPQLLGNKAKIWQSVFELNIALQQNNASEVIVKLQQLGTEISSYNDACLSAVFNRVLFYAFIENNFRYLFG